MISERHEELTVHYLLEQLPAAEREAFERELADNPELATYVNETRDALAIHVLAQVPQAAPSPDLRERILAGVRNSEEKPDQAAKTPAPKRSPWPILISWGIAAGLAWLSLSFYGQREVLRTDLEATRNRYEHDLVQAHAEIAELREQASLDQLRLAGLASQVENQPYFGFVVWKQEDGEGVLRVYNLPKLNPTEKDYQLWVVDPQYGTPVDAGVFQVGDDGAAEFRFRTKKPVENAAAFAVSLEKQGGVPVAEGPMMVLGK